MISSFIPKLYQQTSQLQAYSAMSSNNKPTPYAFAPTKDGRKLPWELGRPDVGRQLEPVPTGPRASTATDDHSSTAESSASPSPFRPGRAFDMWREQRAQPVPEQVGEQYE